MFGRSLIIQKKIFDVIVLKSKLVTERDWVPKNAEILAEHQKQQP